MAKGTKNGVCLVAAWLLSSFSIAGYSQVQIVPAFPNLKFNGNPVFLTSALDGSNRIFVVEQAGKIWAFPNQAQVTPAQLTLFGDFAPLISRDGPELGLLGLAFPPDFVQSKTVYVSFTDRTLSLVVGRVRVATDNPNRIDPRTFEEVIRISKVEKQVNHNGGMIAFSPKDRLLYIGTGDGGGAGDRPGNSQNKGLLLGKILRINPFQAASPSVKYSIPIDNPFISDPAARPEIFALGLRNPWRFSFDRLSGLLFAGDVGQNRFEEINVIQKGGNYGWNVFEGFSAFNNPGNTAASFFQPPILTYGRDQGVSVTGGYVYRGKAVAGLSGWYLYSDFGSGKVWALAFDGVKVVNNQEFGQLPGISAFGEDEQGEVFLVTLGGGIFKLQ